MTNAQKPIPGSFEELFANIKARVWTGPNQAVFLAWLGTAVRAAIIAAGAWLKATGRFPFITGPTIDKVAGYSPQIAGDLIIVAGLAWSALQKWIADRRLKTALVLPPAATAADLAVVMKKTSPGLIPTGPIPTPAQAAKIVSASK